MGIVGRGRACGVQSLQGNRVTSERDKAIQRHEARTLGRAANVYPVHTPDPQGGLDVLGRVHAVTYTGTLQGDGPHLYEHKFDPDAAPLLGADSRGQLFIFGGRYTTTDRGITDTDPAGVPGGFEGEQVNPRHQNPPPGIRSQRWESGRYRISYGGKEIGWLEDTSDPWVMAGEQRSKSDPERWRFLPEDTHAGESYYRTKKDALADALSWVEGSKMNPRHRHPGVILHSEGAAVIEWRTHPGGFPQARFVATMRPAGKWDVKTYINQGAWDRRQRSDKGWDLRFASEASTREDAKDLLASMQVSPYLFVDRQTGGWPRGIVGTTTNPLADTLIRGGRKARELARKGAKRVGEWSAREAAAACRELGYTKGNPPQPLSDPPSTAQFALMDRFMAELFWVQAFYEIQQHDDSGVITDVARLAWATQDAHAIPPDGDYILTVASDPAVEDAQENPGHIRNVTPNPTLLPLAPENRKWNAAAARKRIKRWATKGKVTDWNRYARGFLYRDPAHPSVGYGFKLPIADVIKGRLVAVPHAIEAAGGVLDGARGGVDIPKAAHNQARRWVESYYRKMGKVAPWPPYGPGTPAR